MHVFAKMLQDVAKMAQDVAKMAQDGAKMGQDGAKKLLWEGLLKNNAKRPSWIQKHGGPGGG